MIKKGTIFILILLFFLAYRSTVFAVDDDFPISPPLTGVPIPPSPETNEPSEDIEDASGEIIAVFIPSVLNESYVFPTSFGDDTFASIHSYLDSIGIGATLVQKGEAELVTLEIEWDYTLINPNAAGNYRFPGRLVAPEHATFAADVQTEVAVTVKVEESIPPDTVTLVSAETPASYDALLVPQGSDSGEIVDELTAKDISMTCYDKDGNAYDFPVLWSISTVSPLDIGRYDAVGAPKLDEGFVLSSDFTARLTHVVLVQKSGNPDLQYAYPIEDHFFFPWIVPDCAFNQISVWMCEEKDGAWQLVTENESITENGLLLSKGLFSDGVYRLQVDYPGGQSGIFTVLVDGESIFNLEYTQGNRDGGDSSGIQPNPPDTIQPPATSEPEAIPSPPPSIDSSGDTDGDHIAVQPLPSIPLLPSQPTELLEADSLLAPLSPTQADLSPEPVIHLKPESKPIQPGPILAPEPAIAVIAETLTQTLTQTGEISSGVDAELIETPAFIEQPVSEPRQDISPPPASITLESSNPSENIPSEADATPAQKLTDVPPEPAPMFPIWAPVFPVWALILAVTACLSLGGLAIWDWRRRR